MESINKEVFDKRQLIQKIIQKPEIKKQSLLPDPILNLKYIMGYSAQKCPKISFSLLNETNKDILFPSGSILIKFEQQSLQQKFFFGHSKPITNYILSSNGLYLFSAQEGPNAIIRIWKVENCRCIKMLATPFDKINSLSLSKDGKYLSTVGLQNHNKELIVIWDLSDLDEIKVFIRQGSHFPISCLKFSPYEPNLIISCGKENIKFWRIKNDHLSGKAVVLNQYARNNTFNCVDFDNPFIGEFSHGKAYVGSSQGCVFQISCSSLELEAIYKIQDSAILSIAVNDAFCVTGSADGFLRVWPVDFSEYLMEAKHDSGVCSVDISFDALDIICGTLNGSIGLLNIQSKDYKTLLRSPPNLICQMSLHPSGEYLFTLEEHSIRVWDIEKKSEAFQFISMKDAPSATSAPFTSNIFACGFTSGTIKVFDIDNASVLYEAKPFNTPIKHIAFIQNYSVMIVMNSQGHMSLHDASTTTTSTNNFMQIKMIKIDEPAPYTDLSMSTEGDYFATIGPESNCALIWNSATFGLKNRIPINNFFITKLCLINKNILCVILSNNSILVYNCVPYEGIIIKEFPNQTMEKIQEFIVTKNFKYLIAGTEQGMIKVYDAKMLYRNFVSYQHFIGHSTVIKSLVCSENKSLVITASERDGIFFWNFLGDVTFTDEEMLNEMTGVLMKKASLGDRSLTSGNISGFGQSSNVLSNKMQSKGIKLNKKAETVVEKMNPEFQYMESRLTETVNSRIKIDGDRARDRSAVNNLLMLPVDNDESSMNFSIENIHNQSLNNITNQTANKEYNQEIISNLLYFKSTYLPENFQNSASLVDSNYTKLTPRFTHGPSLNAKFNIIYQKENRWMSYIVNNKVIIEYLVEDRQQIILNEHIDEISSITLTPNGKFLITTSGQINREKYASICLFDTKTWQLHKKLNFHYKGIQKAIISNDNNMMLTIGNNEEKTICLWNLNNFSVVDSKNTKFAIFDAKFENFSEKDNAYLFISASLSVLSFWKLDNTFRLEGFHLRLEDITRNIETGEVITAIETTHYIEAYKSSFVLLGTSLGAVIVVDKAKKVYLKKILISNSPITRIYYSNERIVIMADNPILYCWINNEENDLSRKNNSNNNNLFSLFEKEQPKILLFEANLRNMYLVENGLEGIVYLDNGAIYYVDLEQFDKLVTIASHSGSSINALISDKESIFTSGNDSTIRVWNKKTLDQQQCLYFAGDECNQLHLANDQEEILGLFNRSFIRVLTNKDFKCLARIKLPDTDIKYFSMLFNGIGILCITSTDKIYILDVQNWNPLSILFSELQCSDSSTGTTMTANCRNIFPKNQFTKTSDVKDVSNEESLAVIAFSDGTIITMRLTKTKGRIDSVIVDKFNMFEYHIMKSEDTYIAELYNKLAQNRTDYICEARFSKDISSNFIYSYHETLQYLYIRNYSTNEIFRRIPINFFPICITIGNEDHRIIIGTKEGIILHITKKNTVNSTAGYALELCKQHYDSVKAVFLDENIPAVLSSSYSEMIYWSINQ